MTPTEPTARALPKRSRRIKDPEIRAMRDAWKLLAPFDWTTRRRMIQWLSDYSNDLGRAALRSGAPSEEGA